MAHEALQEAILIRFRNGDGAAFAEVMRAYGGLVRHVVRGFWCGAFREEEAMQEVWLQVYRKREQLDPERLASFTAWLATLARRRCIDLKRQEARAVAGESELAPATENMPDQAAEPTQDAHLQHAELRAAIDTFKDRLKPAWRDFFEAHFVQGQDYAALSARFGISHLRCKYMKRVLMKRARANHGIAAALGRDPAPDR